MDLELNPAVTEVLTDPVLTFNPLVTRTRHACTCGAVPTVRRLADETRLFQDTAEQRVATAAHRWYEHLIGLWAPAIIEAAHDLGLFPVIASSPRAADEVASLLGTDLRATRVLLEALSAYELVERSTGPDDNPRYLLAADSWACVAPDGLYSLAGKMEYDRQVAWDAWRNLASAVRRGARDEDGRERANQISDSNYEQLVRGINFWAPPVVEVLSGALRQLGWSSSSGAQILDVGCGAGLYGHLLLREFSRAEAVGLDVERIVPIARAQAVQLGVSERYRADVVDFRYESWGFNHDLVFFANIFHLQTVEGAESLIRRAAGALRSHGVLAIVDHIIDDTNSDSVQNRFFRLFAASMLATGGGTSYDVADYDRWLASAGLRRVGLLATPMHRLLLAQQM